MPKKNLAEALTKSNGNIASEGEPENADTIPSSRQGKKHIGAYFDLSAYHQLNLLAAEQTMDRNQKVN